MMSLFGCFLICMVSSDVAKMIFNMSQGEEHVSRERLVTFTTCRDMS